MIDNKDTMKKLIFTPKEELIKMILILETEEKNLISYLENMLDGTVKDNFVVVHVKDILERIKSDKCD